MTEPTIRTISLACEATKHHDCTGKTKPGNSRTPHLRPCTCACHVYTVQTYTSRGGEQVNLMSDGSVRSA